MGKVPRYLAIDETELVSYSRYGDRLRMTAVAEFAGYNKDLNAERQLVGVCLSDFVIGS